jgi:chaperone BCS1
MGVGLTLLRQGLIFGVTALERRMFVSLEINNKDRSYEWFLAWMSRQNRASRWLASHELSVETTVEQRKNGSSSALFNLVAGPGTHWFKYHGAWMKAKSIP